MGSACLLNSLADIDDRWLEQVLRGAGYELRVTGLKIEPIGAGNVSDTARIAIEAEGRGPRSVVAKFRPATEEARAHAMGSGAYAIEAGAYELFRKASGGCRTPVVYSLVASDDNINLVMEDLSETTRPGNQVAGCSIQDAAATVTQLAKLHQSFWPMSEECAPSWAIRMPISGDYWVEVLRAAAPIAAERFADHLPARHIAIIEESAKLSRTWHDLKHPTMAITHGDPRVDNVLFDDQNGGEAILIDWQVTGVRNPMHDVGYFLSGSISIEDRRKCERDLLDLYAQQFTQAEGYTRRQIEDDYRVQLVSGLMTTAAAVGLLPDVPKVNELLLALLERNCAAVDDWQSLKALKSH
jgi:hypothetical protein